MNSSEKLATPFYKILTVLSLSLLIVFAVFFAVIRERNNELKKEYQRIESDGRRVFATLTEYHKVTVNSKKFHTYTYMVPDEKGKLFEITETVDDKTYIKLRIGDTIQTKQIKVKIAGKEKILSRIIGNTYPFPEYDYIEKFCISGLAFGFGVLLLAGVVFVFKR